jgi:hypothetical protein
MSRFGLDKRFICAMKVTQARVVHTPVHTWQIARAARGWRAEKKECCPEVVATPARAHVHRLELLAEPLIIWARPA